MSIDYSLLCRIKANDGNAPEAYEALYNKYFPLVKKMYGQYIGLLTKTPARHAAWTPEEYTGFAFEVMTKAVTALSLSKLPPGKEATWGFWIQFDHYLTTYNGLAVRELVKIGRKEKASEVETMEGTINLLDIDIENKSTEDQYEANMTRVLFWQAVDACKAEGFTEIQSQIWDMREKEVPVNVIQTTLGLNPYRYRREFLALKDVFYNTLKRLASEACVELQLEGCMAG